jgi:chaperone BCS1
MRTSDGSWGGFQETMTIRMVARSARVVRDMLEEARSVANAGECRIGVYASSFGDWCRIHEMRPRPLESVVLPAGEMERIVADAEAFLDSAAWYAERGITWRRGYLFEGVPGSGKTSTIAALAGHLGLDLYVCTISDATVTDERLMSMLLRVPERSAVLLEDVDGVVNGREMQGEVGVTFSGLLNALDGVASRSGILTFLTTNHVERLDPALLRPGRVDYRQTFHAATAEQAERYFLHFYGDEPDTRPLAERFARLYAGQPVAEMQRALTENRDDPTAAAYAIPSAQAA